MSPFAWFLVAAAWTVVSCAITFLTAGLIRKNRIRLLREDLSFITIQQQKSFSSQDYADSVYWAKQRARAERKLRELEAL